MPSAERDVKDIFQGADRIEILGKLPFILWEYINHGRRLIQDMGSSSADLSSSFQSMERMLGVLGTAADHLGNEELKGRLEGHSRIITSYRKGDIPDGDFTQSFGSELASLEKVAGNRPNVTADSLLPEDFVERELQRAEKVKTGRSADVVVSGEILDDIRDFLTSRVLTEEISSILIIDNAGTLIVNVGNKVDLDAISLAAVAAANFAATEKIARLIGERDFVLLFYKGRNESFHFRRLGTDYIIVTIFNNSLSLGLIRLKIAEVAQVLERKLPKREG
jgi:predicted regulator of Ras-like GTPase activity (Roadblock/LC7/MglB family)